MSILKIVGLHAVLTLLILNVSVKCCNTTFEGTKITALQDIFLKDEVTDYNYFTKAKPATIIPVSRITGCITSSEELINAVAIEIRAEKVPVLYEGAIQNLPLLHSLHVISCGVTDIKPGAFQNLPSLFVMKIQDNSISSIPVNVFNKLMVRKLILTFNIISYIHPEAFNDMPRLESVNLNFNRLSMWNPDWFWNCPRVKILSVKFNELTMLPGKAFRNIQATLERLYLANNKITDVSPRAFAGLRRLTDLSLRKNDITELDDFSFLYLDHLRMIDMSDTNVTCFSDSLLNTLRSDVLLWIEDIPLNETCLTILKEWAEDNRNTLTFFKHLRSVAESTVKQRV